MSALEINSLPDEHIIAGYVTHIKVIDENGEMYWATRMEGLNDMEAYGMAQDMANSFRRDLTNGKEAPRDD